MTFTHRVTADELADLGEKMSERKQELQKQMSRAAA